MLTLYRRHKKGCPHRSMRYKRCHCPIWVFGTHEGERIRQSLNLTNWEKAQRVLLHWEVNDAPREEVVTVETAARRYLDDAKARQLGISSQEKYRLMFRELTALYGRRNIRLIGVDDVARYRESWKLAPLTSHKKLERLRTFFRFCLDRGWTKSNPALAIKIAVVDQKPTLPYTEDEMERIVWATELYPYKPYCGGDNRQRIKAFVELMRYSGLCIADAASLRRDALDEENRLFLYTQKTGVPVFVPLPDDVASSLRAVKNSNPDYFFWTGNGVPDSAANNWHRILQQLFKLSDVPKAHSHRFRDTFSVSLLQAGVPLETISILLGHRSIKTTERHYAP